MSLLLNNIILNNDTLISFEKEETSNKETKTLLDSFKMKQKLIHNKISTLELQKKNKSTLNSLNLVFLKKFTRNNFLKSTKKKSSNDFILYVIHVSILKKNTTIHVTDTKGQLKLCCSASFSLKLAGQQKKKQPKVLIGLVQYFLKKKVYLLKDKKYNKRVPVALHSRYISKNFLKIVVQILKKKFFSIKTINYSNFYPHNGCRPKKIRRLKRQKKNKRIKKRPFLFL